jgi:DNA replicative helicase MCM subunit Mcm2 (Cdc46/Mcm family)
MSLECCYFCGVPQDTVLCDHHVIPKRIDRYREHEDRTVTLCQNCHKKVHDVLDPAVDHALKLVPDDHDCQQSDSSSESDTSTEAFSLSETQSGRFHFNYLKHVVDQLAKEHDHGAPVKAVEGIILENTKLSEGGVEGLIETLRDRGEMYEPRTGVLRTT